MKGTYSLSVVLSPFIRRERTESLMKLIEANEKKKRDMKRHFLHTFSDRSFSFLPLLYVTIIIQ